MQPVWVGPLKYMGNHVLSKSDLRYGTHKLMYSDENIQYRVSRILMRIFNTVYPVSAIVVRLIERKMVPNKRRDGYSVSRLWPNGC